MPLDKRCSRAAVDANYRQLYDKEGKRNPQLSAIVLSVLKKACGTPDVKGGIKQVLKAAGKAEGRRWVELSDLFNEDLPSSPVVRGLSFDLPGGMRGVGTSPAAAPPHGERGLSGRLSPPIPLEKCPKCGRAYNKAVGQCRCGMREAVNLAGG